MFCGHSWTQWFCKMDVGPQIQVDMRGFLFGGISGSCVQDGWRCGESHPERLRLS